MISCDQPSKTARKDRGTWKIKGVKPRCGAKAAYFIGTARVPTCRMCAREFPKKVQRERI